MHDKTAIGILIRNRWDLTSNTLMSLYYSSQSKNTYDVFIIDNKSDDSNVKQLKKFVSSELLPIKNVYLLSEEMSIPQCWNLFMGLTYDYSERIKIDNDIVLLKTIVPSSSSDKKNIIDGPAGVDPLSGAPRSGSIIGGITLNSTSATGGIHYKKSDGVPGNSNFIQHMKLFSKENGVEIVSLLPVPPDGLFVNMFNEMIGRKINGRNFLLGGCIQISKKAYDKLGYFDERLSRQIDIEYTQRAIRKGINIGYHPSYWVVHMGAGHPTEPNDQYQIKMASSLRSMETPIEKTTTIWEPVWRQIYLSSKKSKIVNIY